MATPYELRFDALKLAFEVCNIQRSAKEAEVNFAAQHSKQKTIQMPTINPGAILEIAEDFNRFITSDSRSKKEDSTKSLIDKWKSVVEKDSTVTEKSVTSTIIESKESAYNPKDIVNNSLINKLVTFKIADFDAFIVVKNGTYTRKLLNDTEDVSFDGKLGSILNLIKKRSIDVSDKICSMIDLEQCVGSRSKIAQSRPTDVVSLISNVSKLKIAALGNVVNNDNEAKVEAAADTIIVNQKGLEKLQLWRAETWAKNIVPHFHVVDYYNNGYPFMAIGRTTLEPETDASILIVNKTIMVDNGISKNWVVCKNF